METSRCLLVKVILSFLYITCIEKNFFKKIYQNKIYLFIFLYAGVEKKNDDVRRNFHRKINRWDPCGSLLIVEKRQDELLNSQREKRSYTKANVQHWEEGGKSNATKKYPRIST